ncbi:MAG: hypothetical protein JWO26_3221 [Rhodospirillales bacterium]|nr:hypothetical protein [Rhodospirillales bacterium]MDB5383589.1 hypothetical protein [Rhodospirillales bacterium]
MQKTDQVGAVTAPNAAAKTTQGAVVHLHAAGQAGCVGLAELAAGIGPTAPLPHQAETFEDLFLVAVGPRVIRLGPKRAADGGQAGDVKQAAMSAGQQH